MFFFFSIQMKCGINTSTIGITHSHSELPDLAVGMQPLMTYYQAAPLQHLSK